MLPTVSDEFPMLPNMQVTPSFARPCVAIHSPRFPTLARPEGGLGVG